MNKPSLRFPEFKGEWEKKKLGEVTSWKSGGTPSKDISEYWGGNIPWISAASMRGMSYNDSDRKITELGLKKGSRMAAKGSLLLLVRGSMLFNTIPVGITMRDVAFNQDVKAIITHNQINSIYTLYWFISNESNFLNLVTGTGIGAGKLDLSDLQNFKIFYPYLPEQTKIASFLSAVDEKLQVLKKKKSLLEDYKKGVMQKIFSQELRFKNDNGKEYPEWEEKQVKGIFQITRGNVLAMPLITPLKNESNIYPVYSSQTRNTGLAGYFKSFLFEDAITWTTDGAGAGDVNFRKGKFYCTNVCGVLINNHGFANLFIAELLNSISRKYVSYVGNPKLMNNVMAEISITIPNSVEEHNKISDFFSSIDEKINYTQTQIEKTETWKKGLLQKMFV